ncbi:cupin domain-containing protein [Cohnella rhizosphaerae]|uniref:Cupin domain-containing protein n=1 Tax=Cohnella rhizosphaerae TaxID=1457232 RepID=A0A9X4KW02_9BACL|nr:cupin domain-containing protein [Cohnella rhizosphaerae]MDG0811336.1 cupin domain-containing protein [Cohnella rhizosphaerae]
MSLNEEWQYAEPGVRRKIVAAGTAIMGMLVEFEAGAEGAVHAHPHEQLTYVAKGELVFRIGDAERSVSEGDTVYIPSNALHGVRALTPATLFDTFTPLREDLLAAMGVSND